MLKLHALDGWKAEAKVMLDLVKDATTSKHNGNLSASVMDPARVCMVKTDALMAQRRS
jgi:hypothetical protein